ncbi:hypothetical protein Tco_0150677 [Tanacetum coccineum]
MSTLTFAETHNMIAFLEKSAESDGFHEIINFLNANQIHYALTVNPTIYTSCIKQFWAIAKENTVNGECQLQALVDNKRVIIMVSSIRSDLHLEDAGGIDCLPIATIFEELARMGYEKPSQRLTFYKGHFSPQWKFFIHTILHCLSPKKTAWEQFSSNIATAIICLATNRTFNFSKFIFDAMVKNLDSTHKFLMYPRFIQIFLNKHQRLLFPHTRTYPTPSLTHKLFSNMKRVSKGFSGVITPLFDTMLVQHQGEEPSIQTTLETSPSKITSSPSLSSHHQHSQPITPTKEAAPMPHESPLHNVHSLGRDEDSMQQHELMDLVTKLTNRIRVLEKDLQQTKKTYSTALTRLILRVKNILLPTAGLDDYTTNIAVSIADAAVTTASASISTVIPLRVSTAEGISGAETLKRVQVQMSIDEELAKKVFEEEQASFNGEQEARFKAEQEQERIDFETALELQKQLDEREEVTAKEAHDIDWSDPSVLRYQNQGGYKMSHFKGITYEEIRPIFERVWDQIHSFVPMDSEKEKGSEKKTRGRRKKSLARKRSKETLSEESVKNRS